MAKVLGLRTLTLAFTIEVKDTSQRISSHFSNDSNLEKSGTLLSKGLGLSAFCRIWNISFLHEASSGARLQVFDASLCDDDAVDFSIESLGKLVED
jgi:hypothetical protein